MEAADAVVGKGVLLRGVPDELLELGNDALVFYRLNGLAGLIVTLDRLPLGFLGLLGSANPVGRLALARQHLGFDRALLLHALNRHLRHWLKYKTSFGLADECLELRCSALHEELLIQHSGEQAVELMS